MMLVIILSSSRKELEGSTSESRPSSDQHSTVDEILPIHDLGFTVAKPLYALASDRVVTSFQIVVWPHIA